MASSSLSAALVTKLEAAQIASRALATLTTAQKNQALAAIADVIDANLTGAFRTARRATKGLLKLKRGRLIFIGSVVGLSGSSGQVNYSASKAGLVGMARSFARELGSRGITSNVVAPGFVETDMTATLDEKRRDEHATRGLRRFARRESGHSGSS